MQKCVARSQLKEVTYTCSWYLRVSTRCCHHITFLVILYAYPATAFWSDDPLTGTGSSSQIEFQTVIFVELRYTWFRKAVVIFFGCLQTRISCNMLQCFHPDFCPYICRTQFVHKKKRLKLPESGKLSMMWAASQPHRLGLWLPFPLVAGHSRAFGSRVLLSSLIIKLFSSSPRRSDLMLVRSSFRYYSPHAGLCRCCEKEC